MVALLLIGHERYPSDTDILGDILCYGLKCRSRDEIYIYYNKLMQIPKKKWTWRAFTFSFDFLMNELMSALNEDDESRISAKIEVLLEEYKKNAQFFEDQSDREKAYISESEYYFYKREIPKALQALEDGMEALPKKCAQCALKLADFYFEKGDYAKVIAPAKTAVSIRESQASISLGYTNYILAMSMEFELRDSIAALSESNVRPVYSAYNAALVRMESGRTRLINSIEEQVKILEFDSGIPSNINFDNSKGMDVDFGRILEALQGGQS